MLSYVTDISREKTLNTSSRLHTMFSTSGGPDSEAKGVAFQIGKNSRAAGVKTKPMWRIDSEISDIYKLSITFSKTSAEMIKSTLLCYTVGRCTERSKTLRS